MKLTRLLPVLTLLVPPLAYAHPGHAESATFMVGFMHPLTGFDHLLAMLAVGLWSAALKPVGTQQLALPATFVCFLLLGLAFGTQGVTMAATEPMIAVSLLVLGLLAGISKQIPQSVAFALVALFAVFHGYAHGSEMGASGAAIAGIALSTAMLHITGLCLGLNANVRRIAAGIVAAGGVFFLLQLA